MPEMMSDSLRFCPCCQTNYDVQCSCVHAWNCAKLDTCHVNGDTCDHGNPPDECQTCGSRFMEGFNDDASNDQTGTIATAQPPRISTPTEGIGGAGLPEIRGAGAGAAEPQNEKGARPASTGELLVVLRHLYDGVKYNKLHDAFDARAVLREIGKSGSGFNEAVVKNTSEGHVDEAFRVYSDERAQAALEAAGYQREHEDGDEIVHWPGFLVSNRVTSITAEESTALPFLVDLAARATTGRTWLDGAENESTLDVIFVSSANKVLDLFRQFGGDTKKFHCLRSFDFDQANGVIDALPNFDVESFVLMLCPLEVSNINDDAAARKTLERMRRLMYAPIVYCVAPSTRSKGTRGR